MTLYFLSGMVVGAFIVIFARLVRDAYQAVEDDIDKSSGELG